MLFRSTTSSLRGILIAFAAALPFTLSLSAPPAQAQQKAAKYLFGAKKLPAHIRAQTHGFYNKGCLAGGVALPIDGPTWQAMRLSRNRRWGHPDMIELVVELSKRAKKDGWNGLLVGDISQPRGGPMLSGHASHQVGLDTDIWLRPMPNKRFTRAQRESVSAISMLKKGTVRVDDRIWTRQHEAVLRNAAQFPATQRIFVHPGIKKKLCDTVRGDRRWLQKVRPYWGHHYHFHIRITCRPGSPGCKAQAPVGRGDGCDASLDWWFKVAFAPKKKVKKKKTAKKKKPVKVKRKRLARLSDLPQACRTVLNANAPTTLAQVTFNSAAYAPGAATTAAARAISSNLEESIEGTIPLPKRRPAR
ncbi:MAG: penicillin-insensitive murein endopeptidase [Pseudomonadota bacterium]